MLPGMKKLITVFAVLTVWYVGIYLVQPENAGIYQGAPVQAGVLYLVGWFTRFLPFKDKPMAEKITLADLE